MVEAQSPQTKLKRQDSEEVIELDDGIEEVKDGDLPPMIMEDD